MPIRPLLLVAALVAGDYLLWNWSSGGASTTIALISGLALAPLILAFIWLTSITVTRLLLVRSSRRSRRRRPAKSARLPAPRKGNEGAGRSSERQSSEKIAA